MERTAETYIDIIYGDFEKLSDEDKEKREKDKKFLEEHLDEFEEMYLEYRSERRKMPKDEFFRNILNFTKKEYCPVTKCEEFVRRLLEVWELNNLATQKMETAVAIINFGNRKSLDYLELPEDDTTITLDEVYELTEEFLGMVDEEGGLLDEFKKLKAEEKIEILPPNDEGKTESLPPDKEKKSSYYSTREGIIKYVFDGTVNSAYTLVHEFMHHICVKEAQTNMGYYECTFFREFLNIYYENAFIKFMDEKGLLPNGQAPILADRFKKQNKEDPENALPIYMELSDIYVKNGQKISEEDMLSVASKYFTDFQDENDLLNKVSGILMNFKQNHILGRQVAAGFTTYKFSTALAHATSLNEETVKKMFKLAKSIKNGTTDIQTFNLYLEEIGKTEQEFLAGLTQSFAEVDIKQNELQISVEQIADRTVKPGQLKGKNVFSKIVSGWNDKEVEQTGDDIDND